MEFNTIEPLIEKESFSNETLNVTFKCSETNVEHSASVRVEQGMKSKLMANAGKAAKKELLRSAKRSLSRLIGSALGGGSMGRMGRNLTGSVVGGLSGGGSSSGGTLKGEEREKAIVEAFEQVNSYFTWNDDLKKYIGVQKDLMVPFTTVLEKSPITEKYDKIMMAQMLAEIAASDGSVEEEEKEFLNDFLPEEAGTLDELLNKDKLTMADLEETAKGSTRETMVLLCWGLAFCDDELSPDEKSRIEEFAEWLGINGDKLLKLKDMAAQYVIDQMLTGMLSSGNYEASRNEVYEMAEKLDVSEDVVKKTEINFKKRNLMF